MAPVTQPPPQLKKNNNNRWTQVQRLEQGKVYAGGSMERLSTMMGWTGSRVLYFGDSLWADLVDARRLKGWRTVRVWCVCLSLSVHVCVYVCLQLLNTPPI